MARKTATTTTDKTDITPLKTGSCPNLLGTATIEYELFDTQDGIQVRLSNYSGNGYYSKARINLRTALESLEVFGGKYPLVSLALKDVYPPNTSCNSWGYLMAVLVAEGLVERLEDNKRHFQLRDPSPFLVSIEELKVSHSKPAKAKPKAKAKAPARMQKGKTKPATYK